MKCFIFFIQELIGIMGLQISVTRMIKVSLCTHGCLWLYDSDSADHALFLPEQLGVRVDQVVAFRPSYETDEFEDLSELPEGMPAQLSRYWNWRVFSESDIVKEEIGRQVTRSARRGALRFKDVARRPGNAYIDLPALRFQAHETDMLKAILPIEYKV